MRQPSVIALFLILAATSATAEDLTNCNTAEVAQQEGSFEMAIESWTRCINEGDLTRDHLKAAYNNRGNAYTHAGDYEQAVQDYGHVIDLDPEYTPAYNGRCWTLALMLRPKDALKDCNRSLSLDPSFFHALDSRALVYWMLNDYTLARLDLKQAREIDPSRPDWSERFGEFEDLISGREI